MFENKVYNVSIFNLLVLLLYANRKHFIREFYAAEIFIFYNSQSLIYDDFLPDHGIFLQSSIDVIFTYICLRPTYSKLGKQTCASNEMLLDVFSLYSQFHHLLIWIIPPLSHIM